jgi:hypothetical protein
VRQQTVVRERTKLSSLCSPLVFSSLSEHLLVSNAVGAEKVAFFLEEEEEPDADGSRLYS